MDIEAWPEQEPYIAVAYMSKNFKARQLAGESDSATSLRMARGWVGGCVEAAKKVKPDVIVYMYWVNARFDRGVQITDWPTAQKLGLAAEPSYYESQNGIDVLALVVRQQRLAIGTTAPLNPWLTNGETTDTGGPQMNDPGRAMFNRLLHTFMNGATGFNIYVDFGVYDMALWLAMRDVIDIVTPYEDLIMDGAPAPTTMFSNVAAIALVSAMAENPDGSGSLLIASSTIPHGLATIFTVTIHGAKPSWKLCDLKTNKSVAVDTNGAATWSSVTEDGSLLIMSANTPCHASNPENRFLKTDDGLPVGAVATVVAAAKRQVRWWTNFENEPHNEDSMLSLIKLHPKSITGIYTYIGAGQDSSGDFSFGHDAATSRNMTWIREKVKLFTDLGITVTPSLSFTNESIMSGNALKKVSEVATFAKAAGVNGLMLGALIDPASAH